jgi:hypothetical protein
VDLRDTRMNERILLLCGDAGGLQRALSFSPIHCFAGRCAKRERTYRYLAGVVYREPFEVLMDSDNLSELV